MSDARICAFCERKLEHVRALIQGPGLEICESCVEQASAQLAQGKTDVQDVCSFCFESVTAYFARAGNRICDPCVVLCVEVLLERNLPRTNTRS